VLSFLLAIKTISIKFNRTVTESNREEKKTKNWNKYRI